jgi:hypothetical protein
MSTGHKNLNFLIVVSGWYPSSTSRVNINSNANLNRDQGEKKLGKGRGENKVAKKN